MVVRPVITGATFAANITTPAEVTDTPDTVWGWFCNALSIRKSDSRAACYATARKVANRARKPVQIYILTSETNFGWKQVDVVTPPERERCEWWPTKDEPATGVEGEGCDNDAVHSVGAKVQYHLCDSCAALPRFARMRRNGRLASHYA